MIREIVRDQLFLAIKSEDATLEDAYLADDLIDTLKAHSHECVGLAANMIGVSKRVIVFNNEGQLMVMFNPQIIKTNHEYEVQEGCLSLDGLRKARRYTTIRVRYQDKEMRLHTKTFKGFSAQIIQHEIDHTNGILI